MQFSTVLLSVIATTGALALPQAGGANLVRVTLGQANGNSLTLTLPDNRRTSQAVQGTDVYDTVLIQATTNADIRCAVLNKRGQSKVADRGDNTDTTFSDAGNGEWDFRQPGQVGSVLCDPAFVAASA